MTNTFPAKYEGICADCKRIIHVGDEIVWVDGDYCHAICGGEAPVLERPTCPRCWQQVSVNGTCGCDPS